MFICFELHAYCLTIQFNRWPLDQLRMAQLRCSVAPDECFQMSAPLFACCCNCGGFLLARCAILVCMAWNDRKVYILLLWGSGGLVILAWDQGADGVGFNLVFMLFWLCIRWMLWLVGRSGAGPFLGLLCVAWSGLKSHCELAFFCILPGEQSFPSKSHGTIRGCFISIVCPAVKTTQPTPLKSIFSTLTCWISARVNVSSASGVTHSTSAALHWSLPNLSLC